MKYVTIDALLASRSAGLRSADNMNAVAQPRHCAASASGQPSRRIITRAGITDVRLATTSISPSPIVSNISAMRAAIHGLISSISLRENATFTSARRRLCSGLSWFTSIRVGADDCSCSGSREENVSCSRAAAATSSYFMSTQAVMASSWPGIVPGG